MRGISWLGLVAICLLNEVNAQPGNADRNPAASLCGLQLQRAYHAFLTHLFEQAPEVVAQIRELHKPIAVTPNSFSDLLNFLEDSPEPRRTHLRPHIVSLQKRLGIWTLPIYAVYSKSLPVLAERRIGTSTIRVIPADIGTLVVDALVNPANTSLQGGGGVDGIVHYLGGRDLTLECEKIGGCMPGQSVVTFGHGLPANYVIHTVGPRSGIEPPSLLDIAYRNSLDLANRMGAGSIAIPAISAGSYGMPLEESIRRAMNAIASHMEETASGLTDIYLVAPDESANSIAHLVRTWSRDPSVIPSGAEVFIDLVNADYPLEPYDRTKGIPKDRPVTVGFYVSPSTPIDTATQIATSLDKLAEHIQGPLVPLVLDIRERHWDCARRSGIKMDHRQNDHPARTLIGEVSRTYLKVGETYRLLDERSSTIQLSGETYNVFIDSTDRLEIVIRGIRDHLNSPGQPIPIEVVMMHTHPGKNTFMTPEDLSAQREFKNQLRDIFPGREVTVHSLVVPLENNPQELIFISPSWLIDNGP